MLSVAARVRPSKRVLPFCLTLLTMAILACVGFASVAQVMEPPISPEFERYMELRSGGRPVNRTQGGYALGFIPPALDLSHLRRPSASAGPKDVTGHPVSFDLRTSGPGGTAEVTAIRNQGACGSCWTFGTLASLESWLLKTQGQTWDLSENNLKECHGYDLGPCDGGFAKMTTAYLARRSGPIDEGDDPYRAWDTGCTGGLDVPLYLRENLMVGDADRVKTLLQSHGALSTSFYWDGAHYNSGENTYYYDGAGNEPTNHCVAVIGWDDSKVVTGAPDVGAWLYRNSWGSGWGDGGYFWLSYYDDHAIDYANLFYDAYPADGTTIHQYDPLGWISSLSADGDALDWAAATFTTAEAGNLESVGFYTTDVDVSVHVAVKRGGPDGAVAYSHGSWVPITDAGYHTLDLTAPVALAAGEKFTVAVGFDGDAASYRFVLAFEKASALSYASTATANPGETYYSGTGVNGTWIDFTDYNATASACIKAIVMNDPPEPLRAEWTFDSDVGSTAVDSSTYGNDGTIYGATHVASPSGQGLQFDGTNDYVGVPDAASLDFGTGDFSVEGWIRVSKYATARGIVDKMPIGGLSGVRGFRVLYVGDRISGQFADGAGNSVKVNSAAINDGTWHHFAFTVDRSGLARMYIDGVQVASASGAGVGSVSNAEQLRVGARTGDRTLSFPGTIDEVRLYAEVLDPGDFNLPGGGGVPLAITDTTLPSGQVNVAYSHTMTASGGTSPYTWSITSGTLPAGVTMSTGGVFSGTPTESGDFPITVEVEDQVPDTASKQFTLTIAAAPVQGDERAYWSFDNDQGATATDDSGNGNDGTIYGATHVASPSGQGLQFDGTNDYVGVPDAASLDFGTGDFSIEGWIRVSQYAKARGITDKMPIGGLSGVRGFRVLYVGDRISGQFADGSGNRVKVNSTAINDGTWHHFAFTVDRSGLARMYIDGVEVASASGAGVGSISNDEQLRIGARTGDQTLCFPGTIDEVRLYAKVLDPGEFNLPGGGGVPLAITDTALPSGQINVAYSHTMTAAGGTSPYTWSITSGTLPNGITMSSGGVFSGTPTESGDFPITIEVEDQVPDTASKAFTLTIAAAPVQGDERAYWSFDNDQGSTVVDGSANGNDGTIYGATHVNGWSGQAMRFDGVNDYVGVPDAASLDFGTGDFSVEGWIRVSQSATARGIVDKMPIGGLSGVTGFRLLYAGSKISGQFADGLGNSVKVNSPAIDDGAWHHFAFTVDRSGLAKMYIDGSEVASASATGVGSISNDERLCLGARTGDRTLSFPGTLDEVRVYARVLAPGDFHRVAAQSQASAEGLDPSGETAIRIYPNPFQGGPVSIQDLSGTTTEVRFDIYDLAGVCVYSSEWVEGAQSDWHGNSDYEQAVANGVYLVHVFTRDAWGDVQSQVLKLVVLR